MSQLKTGADAEGGVLFENSLLNMDKMSADGEAKFWIEPLISLSLYHRLNRTQLSEIQRIIEESENEIQESWQRHFYKR